MSPMCSLNNKKLSGSRQLRHKKCTDPLIWWWPFDVIICYIDPNQTLTLHLRHGGYQARAAPKTLLVLIYKFTRIWTPAREDCASPTHALLNPLSLTTTIVKLLIFLLMILLMLLLELPLPNNDHSCKLTRKQKMHADTPMMYDCTSGKVIDLCNSVNFMNRTGGPPWRRSD